MAVNFSLLFSQLRPCPCDKSKTFLKNTSQFVGRISHLQSHTLSPCKWKIIQLVMLFIQTSQEQCKGLKYSPNLKLQSSGRQCVVAAVQSWPHHCFIFLTSGTTSNFSGFKKNRGIFQSINLWWFLIIVYLLIMFLH